jgi:pyruvate,orthophosphate dikinase
MQDYIFEFGFKDNQNSNPDINLLGGKGARLAEMHNIGLPVPAGFTISTAACKLYYQNNRELDARLKFQIKRALTALEREMGKKLGSPNRPLLLSVRSGAPVSMPGMMDTVLNLGLNDKTAHSIAVTTGNYRFAYDSYRRFIQMYGSVVMNIPSNLFEDILYQAKQRLGISKDVDFSTSDLQEIIEQYKVLIIKKTGEEFPQDVEIQLWKTVSSVFDSWMSERAKKYRSIQGLSKELGTAVNVQAMVFGNMDEASATGVLFTRNPSTGTKELFGEYIINAQGEDIVAGIRTPSPIVSTPSSSRPSMAVTMPKQFTQLVQVASKLERHYSDMQDIEFTIQEGVLWILQTRSGKRTAQAAIKIAYDLVQEGIASKETAIEAIDPNTVSQLLHPRVDDSIAYEVVGQGIPASPGSASGIVVFHSEDAERLGDAAEVILVRHDTSPEDIKGMAKASGILTANGGMTSHASVVARGMGKSCITGAKNLHIDNEQQAMNLNGVVIKQGDYISLNGDTGEIILGKVQKVVPQQLPEFEEIMKWMSEYRDIQVRANAEIPKDVETAIKFGAQGIGLCRTEHMFFETDRINCMRRMILAATPAERENALNELLPFQKNDFKRVFALTKELPVTIRLLDPPLHEFLPSSIEECEDLALALGKDLAQIKARVKALHESNPMLGHRGCRLAVSYPEIYKMQANAIFLAVIDYFNEHGVYIKPEIMVPFVMDAQEIKMIKKSIDEVACTLVENHGQPIEYSIGTMIELPRAALMIEDIVQEVDFISFGTNDLTQTTLGLSRDDTVKFIDAYIDNDILDHDPFKHLDIKGVGMLISQTISKARATKPGIKIGICGEHGGDPYSIAFLAELDIDYVSCSPYRITVASVASAQAGLHNVKAEQKASIKLIKENS